LGYERWLEVHSYPSFPVHYQALLGCGIISGIGDPFEKEKKPEDGEYPVEEKKS